MSEEKLRESINNNDYESTVKYLESGISSDLTDFCGVSMLYWAIERKQIPIALKLLEYGANESINLPYANNNMLVSSCVYKKEAYELISLMLANGFEANRAFSADKNGEVIFNLCIKHKKLDVAKLFLDYLDKPINRNLMNESMRLASLNSKEFMEQTASMFMSHLEKHSLKQATNCALRKEVKNKIRI